MASNTTYGDWMRPMPGGIRNIGIPLTIAGMGVLTCTLLVSMASVVAAIAILVVGMGVILVLAIRDREHRNMVDRAVEKRTWMAAQRTGANLYRSGPARADRRRQGHAAGHPLQGGPDLGAGRLGP